MSRTTERETGATQVHDDDLSDGISTMIHSLARLYDEDRKAKVLAGDMIDALVNLQRRADEARAEFNREFTRARLTALAKGAEKESETDLVYRGC